MSLFLKILGLGGVTAEVNAQNELETVTDQTRSSVAVFSELDEGTITGTRLAKALEATEDYRLRVGVDSVLFHHSFEGTVIARDRIQQNDTTATAAQTTGQLTLNSGNSVTVGQGCNIRTYRTFPLFGSFSTYAEVWAAHGNATATGAVSEWGLGYCSGVTVQLTDGVFFRILAGGSLRAVVVNNSVDISAVDITTTNIPSRDGSGSFDLAETNHYVVGVHNDNVMFWINGALVANIKTTSPYGSPCQSSEQPLFARVYNSGTASAARTLLLRFLGVTLGEVSTGKLWSHQMAGMGGGAYQIQPGTTSGPTVTRGAVATAGWPASATGRATGTWTAASAPAVNSLGGQWVSPAISTLTTEADYPVFVYLNPAGTATLPGKTLYITGVQYGKTVVSAAAAVNSINLNYIIGVGANSAVTNGTESATVVAARGIVLDTIPFKATAVIGDFVEGGDLECSTAPLVIPPGFNLQFIVRPYGVLTSNTLVVVGTVAFVGYFE